MVVPRAEAAGDDIGVYRLARKLGEGGFGAVWLAEQREPVERRVALKVIKLGMDTVEVLKRFEAERQALAMMDHPHIAKVLDAGATEGGRPFFVMEHVPGVPITEYCDTHRLGMTDRLEMFMRVCAAVQHAHQKGIIHRDLKPSNILVMDQDGRPWPKVIDFGIAKATIGRLTDATLVTEAGRLMGTPEYMSPEQAGTTGLDVDTRTDVYSLGVVLYELLTGALPFDSRTLRSGGYEGLIRVIREAEPPKPSTRLTTSADSGAEAARRRGVELRELKNQLRGDLDWIVAKAMEKARNRRYPSASELAADIERFLAGMEVNARPPSISYRLTKFVRRNRVLVGTGGAVAAVVVLGLAGTSYGMFAAKKAEGAAIEQRDRATRAEEVAQEQRQQAERERTLAEREAAKAQATVEFLQLVLQGASPDNASRPGVTMREVLDEASMRLEREFAADAETRAAVRNTIGRSYLSLGLPDRAEPMIRTALEERTKALGGETLDTAQSKNDLGLVALDRGRLEEAATLLREALEIRRKVQGTPPRVIAASLDNLGATLLRLNRLDDAEAALKEAGEIYAKLAASGPAATAGTPSPAPGAGQAAAVARVESNRLNNLRSMADLMQRRGNAEQAEAMLRENLASTRRLLGEHRDVARVLNNLGEYLRSRGKLDDAQPMLEEAVAMGRKTLPAGHPELGAWLTNLGLLKQNRGDLPGAEAAIREAVEIARGGGARAPRADLDVDLRALAGVMLDQGKAAEARPIAEEALERGTNRTRGDNNGQNRDTAFAMILLGRIYTQTGDAARAIPLLENVVAIWAKSEPAEDWKVWQARSALGGAMLRAERLVDAEPLLLESFAKLNEKIGPGHLRTKQAAQRVADLYRAKGDAAKAAEFEQKAK